MPDDGLDVLRRGSELRQRIANLEHQRNAALIDRDRALAAARELRAMVEAYRLWATGRIDASRFGAIADRAVIAFDKFRCRPRRGAV